MLSRVAQMVYWMARYLERAENTIRIVDVNTQLSLDLASGDRPQNPSGDWEPMIHVLGDPNLFRELYGEVSARQVIEYVLFDRRNPNSVYSCIAFARENARCIRETLSSETWEQLNRLFLRLQPENYQDFLAIGSSEYLNRTRLSIQLFYGIAASMLPRNEAWHFFELGRFLERADNTSRLLDVKYFTLLPTVHEVGSTLDLIQWAAVLRSCSAFEAFRKSYRGQITGNRVIEYLFLNEEFPRSIRYSVTMAEEALRRITSDRDHHFSNQPTRSLGKLRAELDYALIQDIIGFGLHEYIDRLQINIRTIHEDLVKTIFDYDIEQARILQA